MATELAHHDTAAPSLGEILETLAFRGGYNTNLVILGTMLLGLATGVIGVFMLLRKRSLLTDAVSHAALPGIAFAFLAAGSLGLSGRALPVLLFGAAVSGVLGALCVHAMLRVARLHEDAAIGIVLSVFFGVGVVALSYIQKNAPTDSAGLTGLIYGQAATMRPPDVMLMGSLALATVLAAALLFKEFSLVCFNDAFARVDGWPVGIIDLAMMALVVLATVAGLQAVGIILVVALLIIPAVAARFWTERLLPLVVIAGAIGAASGYLGSVISALLPRKPAGAVIVLTAAAIFLISFLCAPSRGLIASSLRRLRLRLRIAGDHLLEFAHDRAATELGNAELAGIATVQGWSRLFQALVLLSLRRARMVSRSGDSIVLSPAGVARGARVARNHALWEQYLVSYADIAPSHVDWSVDQVEHVLSDRLIAELEARLPKASGGRRS